MSLANEVRPIVEEIVKLLNRSHPQLMAKADFTVVDRVFAIEVRNPATDKKYIYQYDRFEAETLLKSPRDSVAQVNADFITREAYNAFNFLTD